GAGGRGLAATRAAGRGRQDPRQDSDPREGLHVLTPAPWARNRARKYFRTRTGSADSRISAKQYPWKSMACSAKRDRAEKHRQCATRHTRKSQKSGEYHHSLRHDSKLPHDHLADRISKRLPSMNMKVTAGVVLTVATMLPAQRAGNVAANPNVLFIEVDDLNHWVTHLGRNKQVMTPNIDRLAKMGVTFSHAYAAAPV